MKRNAHNLAALSDAILTCSRHGAEGHSEGSRYCFLCLAEGISGTEMKSVREIMSKGVPCIGQNS